MADVLIPSPRRGIYRHVVTARLDGRSYTLTRRWSLHSQSWSMDLQSADGSFVVRNAPMVATEDVLATAHHLAACPPGQLRIASTKRRPGIDDFLTDAKVVYAAVG